MSDDVQVYCNECEEEIQTPVPRNRAVLLEAAHLERTGHEDMVYRDV